ncbi:MAG: hypothetical protein FJ096_08440 [Deltaproteobacteria bacterium]|nr:hypothetical protein [Deltaproteobacteria bacterium]
MEALAAGVDADRIEGELGAMCQRSLFFALRAGEAVTQADIDVASRAFITVTERLMPAPVLHGFVEHACATRILPNLDQPDLVPGFTDDESFAGKDAAARLSNPLKKFTREEVLACLRWNQREPEVPVAVAHLFDLIHTYVAALADLVGRRSPRAADRLAPFVAQWQPKNALTFVNVALHVAASRRARGGTLAIDQAAIVDAVALLDRSGAFTWHSKDDDATVTETPLRIHCPGQAFLHKVLANQATLSLVLRFVRAEARRSPLEPDVAASLAFVREAALREEAGIAAHGTAWARMKLAAAHVHG